MMVMLTKKTFLLTMAIFMAVTTMAQQNGQRKAFSPEKFQSDLEGHIIREACLSPAESAAFFPLYNEMRKKQRVVFNSMKRLDKTCPTTDNDCRKAIKERDRLDLELKEIQQSYHNKFIRVLSPTKVFKVLKAEDSFHRGMLKRDWGRRNNKK